MAKTHDYLFKVLLVGETGVGKTSVLLRFFQDVFTDTFISTIGIDYRIRTIDLNGKIIKLQIWDTAGQEKFRCITPLYYREALGIMLVYDITNEKSFENLKGWIKNVEEHSSWYVKTMILGNKCDMNHRRQVSRVRGEQFAKEHGNRKFMEISAKGNLNVEEAFITLAMDILLISQVISMADLSLTSRISHMMLMISKQVFQVELCGNFRAISLEELVD
ncbi:hypothetical protein CHS0354_029564 [Potamilus streckersoni]|uniref:Ras-related protein Rab-13 n=1 Tax=Potamilus streckersoni TaxID=2493646 RepID=A0AAE0VTA9_9BIVA|nr:hypothetical protein CHS0354_029564 [Potamilus streckersoni]